MGAAQPDSGREPAPREMNVEEMAQLLARSFYGEQGRLKRLFSALATCTSSEEARAVIAFHYHRTKSDEVREALRQLFEKFEVSDEEFRKRILPKLRPLYNFTMYYMLTRQRW